MLKVAFTIPDDDTERANIQHHLVMEGLLDVRVPFDKGAKLVLELEDEELAKGEDLTEAERILWENQVPFESFGDPGQFREWNENMAYPAAPKKGEK